MTGVSLSWVLLTALSLFTLALYAPSGSRRALNEVISEEIYWSGAFLSLTLTLCSVLIWIWRDELSLVFGSGFEYFCKNVWSVFISSIFGAFFWILLSLGFQKRLTIGWTALSTGYVSLMVGLNHLSELQAAAQHRFPSIFGTEYEPLSILSSGLLVLAVVSLSYFYPRKIASLTAESKGVGQNAVTTSNTRASSKHDPGKVTNDKLTHVISFVLVSGAALATIWWKPELVKDAPTTLGTVGTFATAYGVIFAVIELHRAKTLSQAARQEAERVFHAITKLYTAREIIECQSAINLAVAAIDENKAIPSSTLLQIIKLYSQVFHAELKEEQSPHRKNRSMLESYTFNPNAGRGTTTKLGHTRSTLLKIAGHLAELQGKTKNYSEYVE